MPMDKIIFWSAYCWRGKSPLSHPFGSIENAEITGYNENAGPRFVGYLI